MNYLLITPSGKSFSFYVLELAVLYRNIHGGKLYQKHANSSDYSEFAL